jgi:CRISPR-associated RAMP protein (TIGR02581 family)
MFHTFENSIEIDFQLVPDGPILVRSGVTTLDPAVAELEFQRTHHRGRPTVFLAGSGLKGVLRAHGERLLRTADKYACDPTKRRDPELCFEQKKKDLKRSTFARPFANQCAACFTFGSVNIAGRFHALDAYPAEARWDETNRTESRTQVALDRKSQGPAAGAGSLFEVEVVTAGAFEARVRGENFTLWQLGLVLQSLRDLDTGLVRVGGLKSRGMGAMKVEGLSLRFRTLDRNDGLLTAARNRGGNDHPYSIQAEEPVALPESPDVEEKREGLFRTVTITEEAVAQVSEGLIAGPLSTYLDLEATA